MRNLTYDSFRCADNLFRFSPKLSTFFVQECLATAKAYTSQYAEKMAAHIPAHVWLYA